MSNYEPTLSVLKNIGTKFDYTFLHQSPDLREYVAITEAVPTDIQPKMLAQLRKDGFIEGKPSQIFLPPKGERPSIVYTAMATAAGFISGSQFLTGNFFKEGVGYIAEYFRDLDQMLMKVRIEDKAKGNYKVALKGYLVSDVIGTLTGKIKKLELSHPNFRLGSEEARFIGGGFGRTGKAGYGGFKRIMITNAENFKSGVKIQAIGTVIDLIVDVNTVYLDEKGSRDLSEFLGRAGVSVCKAGATAVLGSLFAAAATAMVTAAAAAVGLASAPLLAVVAVVIGGYYLAATIVDYVDDTVGIKQAVANMAR